MKTPVSVLLARKHGTIHTIGPQATVTEAVERMNEHGVGSIIIVDDDRKLLGIFTERDVLRRIVGAGLDPKITAVSDVMTLNLVTVLLATTAQEIMELFTEKRCRHLPVLDQGHLVGLISIGDVSRWVADVHVAECAHLKHYITGEFGS
jgi:CBS domain-containing protein